MSSSSSSSSGGSSANFHYSSVPSGFQYQQSPQSTASSSAAQSSNQTIFSSESGSSMNVGVNVSGINLPEHILSSLSTLDAKSDMSLGLIRNNSISQNSASNSNNPLTMSPSTMEAFGSPMLTPQQRILLSSTSASNSLSLSSSSSSSNAHSLAVPLSSIFPNSSMDIVAPSAPHSPLPFSPASFGVTTIQESPSDQSVSSTDHSSPPQEFHPHHSPNPNATQSISDSAMPSSTSSSSSSAISSPSNSLPPQPSFTVSSSDSSSSSTSSDSISSFSSYTPSVFGLSYRDLWNPRNSKFVHQLEREMSKFPSQIWRQNSVDYIRLRRQIDKICKEEKIEKEHPKEDKKNHQRQSTANSQLSTLRINANSNPHYSAANPSTSSSAFSSPSASSSLSASSSGPDYTSYFASRRSAKSHDIFWAVLKSEIDKVNTFVSLQSEECLYEFESLGLDSRPIAQPHLARVPPGLAMNEIDDEEDTRKRKRKRNVQQQAQMETRSDSSEDSVPAFSQMMNTDSRSASENTSDDETDEHLSTHVPAKERVSLTFAKILLKKLPDLANALLHDDLLTAIQTFEENDDRHTAVISRFIDLCQVLDHLRKFVVLNYIILLRILKKYDSHTSLEAQHFFLQSLFYEPFYQCNHLALLLARAEAIIEHFVRRKEVKESDMICPLCSHVLVKPVLLNCSHRVCFDCLVRDDSFIRSSMCPQCHRDLKLEPHQLLVESVLTRFVGISIRDSLTEISPDTPNEMPSSTPSQVMVKIEKKDSEEHAHSHSHSQSHSHSHALPLPSDAAGMTHSVPSPILQQIAQHEQELMDTSEDSADNNHMRSSAMYSAIAGSANTSMSSSAAAVPSAQDSAVHKLSCHRCKCARENSPLMHCTASLGEHKKSTCQKKFCFTCLQRLNLEYEYNLDQKDWKCPACRGLCMCAACKKKKLWDNEKAARRQNKATKTSKGRRKQTSSPTANGVSGSNTTGTTTSLPPNSGVSTVTATPANVRSIEPNRPPGASYSGNVSATNSSLQSNAAASVNALSSSASAPSTSASSSVSSSGGSGLANVAQSHSLSGNVGNSSANSSLPSMMNGSAQPAINGGHTGQNLASFVAADSMSRLSALHTYHLLQSLNSLQGMSHAPFVHSMTGLQQYLHSSLNSYLQQQPFTPGAANLALHPPPFLQSYTPAFAAVNPLGMPPIGDSSIIPDGGTAGASGGVGGQSVGYLPIISSPINLGTPHTAPSLNSANTPGSHRSPHPNS